MQDIWLICQSYCKQTDYCMVMCFQFRRKEKISAYIWNVIIFLVSIENGNTVLLKRYLGHKYLRRQLPKGG